MRREGGLAGASGDTAHGSQSLGGNEHGDLDRVAASDGGRQEIEKERAVVENISEEAVFLGLWLDNGAVAVGKANCRDAGDAVLEDGQEHGVGGGRVSIADTKTLENGPVGEEGGDSGEEGLKGVVGLVAKVVRGHRVRVANG